MRLNTFEILRESESRDTLKVKYTGRSVDCLSPLNCKIEQVVNNLYKSLTILIEENPRLGCLA